MRVVVVFIFLCLSAAVPFLFFFEEKWRNGKQGAERASESARLNDTDLASLKIARLMNRLEGHPFRSEQKGVKQ